MKEVHLHKHMMVKYASPWNSRSPRCQLLHSLSSLFNGSPKSLDQTALRNANTAIWTEKSNYASPTVPQVKQDTNSLIAAIRYKRFTDREFQMKEHLPVCRDVTAQHRC